jgi:hypothetical protein
MVTVLGFLLGRDSGFQQRLVGSAVAEFPIIGDQVRDNIHGLRGRGVGLVVGLVAFAWGARGLIQVAQHATAEIWNIPSRQRPSSSMRPRLAARVPAHCSGNPKRRSRWRPPAPNRSAAGRSINHAKRTTRRGCTALP